MNQRASRKDSKSSPSDDTDRLTIAVRQGSDPEKEAARVITGPIASNASLVTKFARGAFGPVKLDHVVAALRESASNVNGNNLAEVEELLTAQAFTLNAMFGELARRAAVNMGEYFDAAQRYLNMALKAQNQCRMTLETLAAVKNPPVVYARQANIAHGPQQVNNSPAAATRAGETENGPNKLLEAGNEQLMDTGTPGAAGGGNSAMEAVGEVDRTQDR